MKKKVSVLVVIYFLFLISGLWFNTQKGLSSNDQFWKLTRDGWYVSPARERMRYTSAGFEMIIADQSLSATILPHDHGGYRVHFSDGWAIECDHFPYLSIEIDGMCLTHDLVYELTDLEKAGLLFSSAARVKEPFYGEPSEPIGEFVRLVASTGETLDYQEVFFDRPELNTPEKELVVLKNGVRFDAAQLHQTLFTNEDGEYLLNADTLTMLPANGGYRDRSTWLPLMIKLSEGQLEQRGDAALILPYTLLYLLGALSFLYPEHAAFWGSRWKFQNEPELSAAGLFSMQLGSVLIMVLAVVMLFIPFSL